jgi:hypothetical protein
MRRKSAKVKKRSKLLLTDAALQALREAVAGVVEDHRQRGVPLAIWRDGRAILIPATEASALHETATPYRQKAKG